MSHPWLPTDCKTHHHHHHESSPECCCRVKDLALTYSKFIAHNTLLPKRGRDIPPCLTKGSLGRDIGLRDTYMLNNIVARKGMEGKTFALSLRRACNPYRLHLFFSLSLSLVASFFPLSRCSYATSKLWQQVVCFKVCHKKILSRHPFRSLKRRPEMLEAFNGYRSPYGNKGVPLRQ